MSIEKEIFNYNEENEKESDLEQYGVWVKKTPAAGFQNGDEIFMEETLDDDFSADKEDSSDFSLSDFDIDEPELIADESDTGELSDDDLSAILDEAIKATSDPHNHDAEDAASVDTRLTEEELSDITERIPAGMEELSDFNIDDIDEIMDITVDDFMDTESQASAETAADTDEAPIDMDLSFDDEPIKPANFAAIQNEKMSFDAEPFESDDSIEEIDITSFGFDQADDSADFDQAENSAQEQEAKTEPIFEEVSDFSDTADFDGETKFDEVNDFDDILLSSDETSVDSPAFNVSDTQTSDSEASYDISVFADDDDRTKIVPPAPEVKEADSGETERQLGTMSASLLNKIVIELDGLRTDIGQLKTELSILKQNQKVDDSTISSPAIQDKKEESGGFFTDDEGDDTIALSGDELNNILTSAEFTAEKESLQKTSEESHEQADEYVNFEQIELDEPEFPDIDFSMDIDSDVPQQLPSEIAIPVLEEDAGDDIPKELDETMEYASQKPEDEIPQSIEDLTKILDEISEEPDDFLEKTEDIFSEFENEFETEDSSPLEAVFTGTQWVQEENDSFLSDAEIAPEPSIPLTEESGASPLATGYSADEVEAAPASVGLSGDMREKIKEVLAYMDELLENLPEDKIEEFARSEHFEKYKNLFTELGLA